ncbi:MAG: sigma-70 family RNA polymerase sigma factor, partial [Pseudomonadota bacterium]
MKGETDTLEDLLVRTATRDPVAFRSLYDRTVGRQLAIARRILHRADLAEEAVHDAYVAIWHSAARYQPDAGSALGWITTIVRRRAIDRLRASPWLKRETGIDPHAHQMSSDTQPETRLALAQCLGELPDAVRRAIRLAYLHGLTHTELSARLDLPLGTLKSRLRRGLAALRE